METATAIRTCSAPAISSKILMYLFAQLNCKMRLQIVRNWNVNMFFMDGIFFNFINLETINEAIKKSSIHKKWTNYLVWYTYFLELKTLFGRTALVWTASDQASDRGKILEVVIVPILLKRGLMCHLTSWSNES